MTSLRTAPAHLSVPAPELAAALDAVRFAVGTDPELPMLGGVLFDIEGDGLQVVATDRYRMAVGRTGTTGHGGGRVQAVVPTPLVDAMRALLSGEATVRLSVDGDRVTLETGDCQTAGQCLGHDFPDYRRLLLLPTGRRALVDVPDFRGAVETGPVRAGELRDQDGARCDLSVLRVADDGTVTVCADGDDAPNRVAVNREFLLEALASGARDRLILEFGAPTAPVAIRRPEDEDTFSILMPVRLEE